MMEDEATNTFSLRDFYYILFRHKISIIVLPFSAMVAVIIGIYLWPETYEARAGILVKVGRENISIPAVPPSSQRQVVASLGLRKEDINSEIEILRNRFIVGKVVEKLGTDFLFPQAPKPKTFFERIKYGLKRIVREVKKFANEILYRIDLKKRLSPYEGAVLLVQKNLSAKQVEDSDVIEVRFRWYGPDIAQEVLDNLIDLYLEHHLGAHKTSGGHEFFQKQVGVLERRLRDSEDKLRLLKQKQEITSYEYQRDLLLQQINSFKASLKNTETDLAETNMKINELKKQLSSQSENIELAKEVKRNPVIDSLKTRLLELELEKKKLENTYLEESRPMVYINEEIQKVRDRLAEEAPEVLETTTTGVNTVYKETKRGLLLEQVRSKALTEKKEMLEQHIKSYLGELGELNAYGTELKRLDRQIRIDERNYELYRQKLEEARISDVLDNERIVNVRVIDSPTASSMPVRPRKLLIIGLGAVLSVFFAIGVALISEYLDHSIKAAEDVKKYLDLPLLASIREVNR